MQQIIEHPRYTREPDGMDALFFVNREYCEKTLTYEQREVLLETVTQLKKSYKEMA